jgi:hypothetical protein
MINLHDIREPVWGEEFVEANMARLGPEDYQRRWVDGAFRQEYQGDPLLYPRPRAYIAHPDFARETGGIVTELYQRAFRIRTQLRDTEGIAMVITPEERTRLYYELIRTELLRPDGEGQDRFMGIPIVVP